MSRRDDEKYRGGEPCPVCAPFYVATMSYTARCPDDSTGGSVTKTAQYKSPYSEKHAKQEALVVAKAAAEAELVCTWEATVCRRATCEVKTAYVTESIDNSIVVTWNQDPPNRPLIGDEVFLRDPGGVVIGFYTVTDVDGFSVALSPDPPADIEAGTTLEQRPVVCFDATSNSSLNDAKQLAADGAAAAALAVCDAVIPDPPDPDPDPDPDEPSYILRTGPTADLAFTTDFENAYDLNLLAPRIGGTLMLFFYDVSSSLLTTVEFTPGVDFTQATGDTLDLTPTVLATLASFPTMTQFGIVKHNAPDELTFINLAIRLATNSANISRAGNVVRLNSGSWESSQADIYFFLPV